MHTKCNQHHVHSTSCPSFAQCIWIPSALNCRPQSIARSWERNWRGVYTARDDDVYEADIDKAKFQRVARKLVEQLTTLRLLQNAGKQEELGGDFAAQIDEDAAGQPGDDSRLASIERSVAAIQKAQQALLERMTERETKLEGMVRSLAEQTSHAMLLQAGVLTANLTPKKNA